MCKIHVVSLLELISHEIGDIDGLLMMKVPALIPVLNIIEENMHSARKRPTRLEIL